MLALELDTAAVKSFMGQLLRADVFDQFDVRNIEISTNAHYSIDCKNDEAAYLTWAQMRPIIFELIKTSPKPKYVKIIFSYKGDEATSVHANAAALFLNLAYENDSVHFTTGTAQREFVFEKSLDYAWDEWVQGFLAKVGLPARHRA